MKWISSSFLVFLMIVTFTTQGCAPASPGNERDRSANPSLAKRAAGKFCEAPQERTQSFLLNRDPFDVYGKVLFDDAVDNERVARRDIVHAPYLRGLIATTVDNAAIEIPSGTKLTVTLKNNCPIKGPISVTFPAAHPGSALTSYVWTLTKALSRAEIIDLANTDACVVGISEATKYRTQVRSLPSDPQIINQKHLSAIEAGAAYDLIYPLADTVPNLRPVTIAIIDTGIDLKHPDLENVLWVNKNEIANNGIDDDKNGYVDDVYGYNFADRIGSPENSSEWSSEHGTHVAGLAAAQGGNGIGGSGVMGQGARIMMLNVFGSDSGAYISDIANALRYAADNGADVINMSIGGSGRNATYESALAYAVSKGVTVIVAAGNEASEIGEKYFESPASYSPIFEGMLAVASTDSFTGGLSTYSNYSAKFIEIAAPGAELSKARRGLLSTWPGGRYSRIQGTSMASPVVAGAAGLAIAMLRARGYAPGPATIEGLLAMSSIKNPELLTKVQDGHSLNLRAVAEFIQTHYPVLPRPASRDPGVPGYEPCRRAAR